MWQAIPTQFLKVRCWDGESVVYNSLSGDTHLLGAAAMHILFKLQETQMDLTGLADSLASIWQMELSQDILFHISTILSDLEALALIESVFP